MSPPAVAQHGTLGSQDGRAPVSKDGCGGVPAGCARRLRLTPRAPDARGVRDTPSSEARSVRLADFGAHSGMESRLLIDNIVRQTTVLIAELATAAGVRAPLAHLADQVFLQLAREIEAQGVGRKVAADMFGLALRTYQRKVLRLTETETNRQRTLWEAVVAFVAEGPVTRVRLRERFRYDDEDDWGAVLADLVSSGLLTTSGRGDSTVYSLTTADERDMVQGGQHLEALTHLVWQHVFANGPSTVDEVVGAMGAAKEDVEGAVAWLVREERLREAQPGRFRALSFVLGVESTQGWEASVFDHFSAVAQAIVHKLKLPRKHGDETVGGSTFTFNVYPGHPSYHQVMSLLARTRTEVSALWRDTNEFNQRQPQAAEGKVKVRFYFGQDVRANGDDETGMESAETEDSNRG